MAFYVKYYKALVGHMLYTSCKSSESWHANERFSNEKYEDAEGQACMLESVGSKHVMLRRPRSFAHRKPPRSRHKNHKLCPTSNS